MKKSNLHEHVERDKSSLKLFVFCSWLWWTSLALRLIHCPSFAQIFCGHIFSLPGPTGRQTEQNQNELCGNNLKRTVLICAKKTKVELDFKCDIYSAKWSPAQWKYLPVSRIVRTWHDHTVNSSTYSWLDGRIDDAHMFEKIKTGRLSWRCITTDNKPDLHGLQHIALEAKIKRQWLVSGVSPPRSDQPYLYLPRSLSSAVSTINPSTLPL